MSFVVSCVKLGLNRIFVKHASGWRRFKIVLALRYLSFRMLVGPTNIDTPVNVTFCFSLKT